MKNITIRTIEPADNKMLAELIRATLKEFNANKPGSVYFDETTDHLAEIFANPKSMYYVAAENGQVIGGGGIYPTENLPVGTCELVKLYLAPAARGKGIGAALLNNCLTAAKKIGYKKIYLETMRELIIAIPLYEKMGFTRLTGPMGNSGHWGCDIWMIKEIGE